MRVVSRTPYKPLFAKDRYSNEVALKSSSGSLPLRLLYPALSSLSLEQSPSPGGTLPLNLLKHRSSTVRDGEVLQNWVGICPLKLLLLALIAIRFSIVFHVVDGNCPANKLLEMFSTCRGLPEVEDGSSWSVPLSWLKLTSRVVMLLDASNPRGRPPDNELPERSRYCSPVRIPSDCEMCPSRPFEGSKILVTVPSCLQVIPSHLQQSVPFRHDAERPPSCESSARNWRREPFSCSVQELTGETKQTSSTRARPREGMPNILLHFLLDKWRVCMVFWWTSMQTRAKVVPWLDASMVV